MSGEVEDISINLLNRKVIVKTGSIENDEEKVTVKKLKSSNMVTIGDIGEAWEYMPEY